MYFIVLALYLSGEIYFEKVLFKKFIYLFIIIIKIYAVAA